MARAALRQARGSTLARVGKGRVEPLRRQLPTSAAQRIGAHVPGFLVRRVGASAPQLDLV